MVPEAIEGVAEKFRQRDADEIQMNYSAPSDSEDSFKGLPQASGPSAAQAEASPTKRRLVGGSAGQEERVLNRAERRRQKGR